MNEWLDDIVALGSEQSSCSNLEHSSTHSTGQKSNHSSNNISYDASCRAADQQRLPQACVLISVVKTRGSCPREAGTRMVVALDTCFGTIGGGNLEYQAIDIARELLSQATPDFRIERFPLGARLGQCCGGVVHLSFEFIGADTPSWVNELQEIQRAQQAAVIVSPVDGRTDKLVVTRQTSIDSFPDKRRQSAAIRALQLLNDSTLNDSIQEDGMLYESFNTASMQIAIFGAGHVGTALVNVLSGMPCRIRWIDGRISEFPDPVPDNVIIKLTDQPEAEVDGLPAGTYVVIMTHNHALDQVICEKVLRCDDLMWCGLIGSATKRRQFEKRLISRGLAESSLSKLVCPIGINGITGKHPAQIAISVAAQLQLLIDSRQRVGVSDDQAA